MTVNMESVADLIVFQMDTIAVLTLQASADRHRMSKAIGLLSTIQASGVLEAHGHDDLNECLEEALGALVGRKE